MSCGTKRSMNWAGIQIKNITIFFSLFSGAEDMHAYVWDRYYGNCLAKYQHTDVVNSVAFNPRDSEMLVTTSDDYTIKVNLYICTTRMSLILDKSKLIMYFCPIDLAIGQSNS